MIFIALALAWAVYLIPKALQQHDELARSRSVDSFSARLRVLGGGRPAEVVAPAGAAAQAPAPLARTVTRAAARAAATRRRRVLYLLTGLLAATAVVAYFGRAPWWSLAVPGALIVVFLMIARLTVRREQVRRTPIAEPVPVTVPHGSADIADDTEDTINVPRVDLDLEAPMEQALADEGSLWDPLPVTLPTYVSKPRARRTVRTIDLTQGQVTSSGHNPADSKLAREAEAAAPKAAEVDSETEQRKAAGA